MPLEKSVPYHGSLGKTHAHNEAGSHFQMLKIAHCWSSLSRWLIDGSGPVSVHLSVTEVHWVAVHAGNTAAVPASEVEAIIRSQTNMTAADGGVISCYASHC